jgi:hypothetical protein
MVWNPRETRHPARSEGRWRPPRGRRGGPLSQNIMNLYVEPRSPQSPVDVRNRCRSAFACSPLLYWGPESRNLNHLVLISFCVARMRATLFKAGRSDQTNATFI